MPSAELLAAHEHLREFRFLINPENRAQYGAALFRLKRAFPPDSDPTEAPEPSTAPESCVVQDSPESPSPPVRPTSGPRSPTLSQGEAQIALLDSRPSERDRSPLKSQPPAVVPKSRPPRREVTSDDVAQYKRYKERMASFKKPLKTKSKSKSKSWADDAYDSPMEMETALSTDDEWQAVANQIDSVANLLVDPDIPDNPDKSDSEDYDTMSSCSDNSFINSGGKRKKRLSPSQATKAKKAVARTSPQSVPPPASPVRQPSPTPAPASASQRDNRSPSPMVTISNPRKPPPPPPIYLQDKEKWNDISNACDERKIKYSKATACQQGIRIQVPTPKDYRDLTRYLRAMSHSFHTYSLPEERCTRVVIRRIPKEIPTEEIRKDLIAQKVPVFEVHRLRKARGGQPYDMVLVVCSPYEGHNPIFNIKTVCSLSGITIEKPYRPHLVGQCHNCQLYGHSQTNCYATPRCVKCMGEHSTKDCPRPKDRTQCTEPPSCVLCGQVGHPANYRGCPKAPKLAPKLAKNHAARQARVAPASQPPPRLAPQRPSPWGKLNPHSVAPQSYSQQPIPALMTIPITAPIPNSTPGPLPPTAPMTAQSQKVAPTTSAAKCPPPVAPSGHKPYLCVAENIISAYSIFMTPQARALDAEIRNAGPLDPVACSAIFSRYESITRELDRLVYIDGQWVRN